MKRMFPFLVFGAGLFLLMGMLWQQVERNTGQLSRWEGADNRVAQDAVAKQMGDGTGSSVLYRRDTSGRADDSAPVVALTFDDGPHPAYTEQLLDGLKERDIKATFFLIGVNVEGHEDIVERMAAEGHLIGNHTYSHVQLTKISDGEASKEIEEANAVLTAACGSVIHYIRPPFGSWQEDLYNLTDMQVVLWSVDPQDWKLKNTDAVVKAVLDHVEDGDIILLHDVYKTSVEAAFQIIDKLKAEGYEFVRVDELLLD